jgi:hypothetical protein
MSIKFSLNIEERLSIAQFLPKESGLSEQLIGKAIMDKTFVTAAERAALRSALPGKD